MRGRFFTFIEVMIATVILGIAAGMVLSILGVARARILRAERRWGREHHLSNCTEFYLLAGSESTAPQHLLPEGFSVDVELAPVEDLPEHAAESVSGWNGWTLAQYRVTVFDPYGKSIGERTVQKIVKEDDLH